MLRCIQQGIRIDDLDKMSMGFVFDIMTESVNDDVKYPYKATQEDMSNF